MDTGFSGISRRNRGFTGTGAPIPEGMVVDNGPSLSRSNTVPPPRTTVDDTRPDTLMRSRTMAASGGGAGGPGLQRSATMAARTGGPGSGFGSGSGMGSSEGPVSPRAGGPTRSLSVRNKPGPPQNGGPPTPPVKSTQGTRLTEIYDDYIEGYNEPPPPVPAAPAGANRVAAWARTNAQPGMTPSRAPSTRAASAYGGYSSSGSLRRKPTRRATGGGSISGRVKTMSSYEEEEEGYVSGDYEEAYELVKIRVKLYYQDDVRGMAIGPEMSWEEFCARVSQKFDRPFESISIKFKDEDGGKVSLRDDSDYELAIETARELAKGKPEGRLEMWVADA